MHGAIIACVALYVWQAIVGKPKYIIIKDKNEIKKITSLVMLWSMIMMTYRGVISYIALHGRVAYWQIGNH